MQVNREVESSASGFRQTDLQVKPRAEMVKNMGRAQLPRAAPVPVLSMGRLLRRPMSS